MAEAILLEDVESLGERGQAVDVSPGYLRNYLIPRKLAAAGDARAPWRKRSGARRPPKRPSRRGPSAKSRRPRCSPRPC